MLVHTLVDAEICLALGFPNDTVHRELEDSLPYRRGRGLDEFYADYAAEQST